MFDKLIIFLTEKKLAYEKKKEQLIEKLDDISYSMYLIKGDIKLQYNKHLKNKVDKVQTYFNNLFIDIDDAMTPLYNFIWHNSDGRIFGYIMSAIISFVLLLLLGVLNMMGLPTGYVLLSLIPISIIPIDIITTSVLLISKRIKRLYNKSLNRMKQEYGVRNNKDLIEAYKSKHAQQNQQEKKTDKKEKIIQEPTKVKEQPPVINNQELTDSEFLEKMFGYVNSTKYIKEEERKAFLDEINNILNKYTQLKNNNRGSEVNSYLRSDVEHLQSEYNRYMNNQSQNNDKKSSYQIRLRRK